MTVRTVLYALFLFLYSVIFIGISVIRNITTGPRHIVLSSLQSTKYKVLLRLQQHCDYIFTTYKTRIINIVKTIIWPILIIYTIFKPVDTAQYYTYDSEEHIKPHTVFKVQTKIDTYPSDWYMLSHIQIFAHEMLLWKIYFDHNATIGLHKVMSHVHQAASWTLDVLRDLPPPEPPPIVTSHITNPMEASLVHQQKQEARSPQHARHAGNCPYADTRDASHNILDGTSLLSVRYAGNDP